MNELCCEYVSVWCILLHVIIMSRRTSRVNLRSMIFLNVKELLARCRCHIWRLSDSNGIGIHNYLVRKQKLNHLAKLAKWLRCVVRTYLHGVFECMLLSCHEQDSEWIHTLYSLSECQGIPCSKQEPYLKLTWQPRNWTPQSLSS